MNKTKQFLIYGANGYTGTLLAQHLCSLGQCPILAGRSAAVRALGQALNCPVRIFSIDNAADALADVAVLINTAGPFKHTQKGLIEACLKTQTHYLDLAGEVPEVQAAAAYAAAAQAARVVLLPAAGFGVAPTDVAARLASQAIDQPTQLTIAYATEGGASRGTLQTVLQDLQTVGVVRQAGALVQAAPAQDTWKGTIAKRSFDMVYNPWRADLVTAYQSTHIPNIKTYTAFPSLVVQMMKGRFGRLRKFLLRYLLPLLPEGPSPRQRRRGATYIHAEVRNANGDTAQVQLSGPEAYDFTVYTVARLAALVLEDQEGGWKMPASYGVDWLLELPGVEVVG